jgi:hypothetical protein
MNNNGICRKIKLLQKSPDGIFGSFMTRPVSHFFAAASYKLHLSPNFSVSFRLFFALLVEQFFYSTRFPII